jgi:DNA invertase Pin-like site-specific DNA recombinase
MMAAKGGKRVGYIRVSSVDQNESRQTEAMAELHIDKTFIDKASGKDTKRPKLTAALEYMRDGDVLVVHSMDRLARNMLDLQTLIADLNSRNIAVEFIKEHLIFTGEDSPMSKLMLSILGRRGRVRAQPHSRAPAGRNCDCQAARRLSRSKVCADIRPGR